MKWDESLGYYIGAMAEASSAAGGHYDGEADHLVGCGWCQCGNGMLR